MKTLMPCICVVGLVMSLALAPAVRAEDLPEGPGLAAMYPGDVGIANDPHVVLAEDFEEDDLAAMARRWSDVSNRDLKPMRFIDDAPPGGKGHHALQISADVTHDTGGHLYTQLSRGLDVAFARFYVKFPDDAGYVHHFVHLGGYRPATNWPQGGAGVRPRGDDRITVGIEPFGQNGRVPPPGEWNFYAYWHDMKISGDGKYWGNGLRPVTPAAVPHGRWQCVEFMIKLNTTPDSRDGELALWLDGKLTAHFAKGAPRGRWTGEGFSLLPDDEADAAPFEGFNFRTNTDLKVNFFWLLHYVTPENQKRNRVNHPESPVRVQFDHIVVADRYVGPLEPMAGPASK
ncbi:MAG: hypothetical protein GC162_10955 [Planctomycetes bacterium]|nr:hypothetical protein [Planctomycetota bacterium]